MLSTGTDFFDGLSNFPRDHSELCRHEDHLKHMLQKRWFMSSDAVDLAMQTEKSEEFNRYYRQQVMRIVGHFNAATRSQLKVRVDPRLPRGMQLMRDGGAARPPRSLKTDASNTTDRSAKVVAAAASARPPPPPLAAAATARHYQLQQQQQQQQQQEQSSVQNNAVSGCLKDAVDCLWVSSVAHPNGGTGYQAPVEGQQTPQTAPSSIAAAMMHGGCITTDGKATVSSYDGSMFVQSSSKKSCREVLFSTPPEFKGFTVPLEASPGDSLASKSPLLF